MAKLVDQYEIVGKLVEYFVDSEELLVETENTRNTVFNRQQKRDASVFQSSFNCQVR